MGPAEPWSLPSTPSCSSCGSTVSAPSAAVCPRRPSSPTCSAASAPPACRPSPPRTRSQVLLPLFLAAPALRQRLVYATPRVRPRPALHSHPRYRSRVFHDPRRRSGRPLARTRSAARHGVRPRRHRLTHRPHRLGRLQVRPRPAIARGGFPRPLRRFLPADFPCRLRHRRAARSAPAPRRRRPAPRDHLVAPHSVSPPASRPNPATSPACCPSSPPASARVGAIPCA